MTIKIEDVVKIGIGCFLFGVLADQFYSRGRNDALNEIRDLIKGNEEEPISIEVELE